jgi:ribokinase
MEKFEHNLIVTLGKEGCLYRGKVYDVPEVHIRDLSGAGDSFIAGLCSKYLETSDIDQSIRFANECATIAVQHRGVVTINPVALDNNKVNNKGIYRCS